MKLAPRFVGSIIKHADAAVGDLLLVDDGTSTRLVFVGAGKKPGQGDQSVRGVVLNEWGGTTKQTYPYSTDFSLMHANGKAIRRVGPEVVFEPHGAAADGQFASSGRSMANGVVLVMAGGKYAILIATSGHDRQDSVWDFQTGERLDPYTVSNELHYVASGWKLVWRDGDEELTLCEFAPSTPKGQS